MDSIAVPILENVPVLSLLLIVPLVGALLTLFMGGKREKLAPVVALIATIATLALAFYVLLSDPSKYGKLDESYVWIKASVLQMNYALHIDGLSILMVFLTALLVFVVVIFSAAEKDRPNYFHTLLLAMEVGQSLVFASERAPEHIKTATRRRPERRWTRTRTPAGYRIQRTA